MRQIVTFGGGGFSMEAGNPLLDEFVLELTGRPRPRVCFLPSASGDADHYIVRFYRHFQASRCDPSHLSLFRRERAPAEPREHLLSQDLIYVGGGQRHQPDRRLEGPRHRRHPARGLGARHRSSAGSRPARCAGLRTASRRFTAPQRVQGLGLLPWSNTVHYSSEPTRREALFAWLRDGMPPAYAADDGAALHFIGDDLAQVVASRPHARAYRVELRHGTSSPRSSRRVIWRTTTRSRWSVGAAVLAPA